MDDRKSFLIRHFGLRGVSLFEASKGVLALLLSGVLIVVRHGDMERMAGRILRVLHISPDRRFYHEIMRQADRVTPHTIWLFVFGVIAYAAMRFIEAGGLWLEREWAEWFALISGSMYVPWEIYELIRRETVLKWIIFTLNLVIILYLVWLRVEMHRMRQARRQAPPKALPELQ